MDAEREGECVHSKHRTLQQPDENTILTGLTSRQFRPSMLIRSLLVVYLELRELLILSLINQEKNL